MKKAAIRSIRLSDTMLFMIEHKAKTLGVSTNRAIEMAILEFVTGGLSERKKRHTKVA